jgi:hypothetical protein
MRVVTPVRGFRAPAQAPARATEPEPAERRGPRLAELAIAWVLLLVLAIAVFLPNVRNSGFSTDDWANAFYSLQESKGSAISLYAHTTPYRPVLILYVPLTYWVFGTHMGLHLAWSVGLAVLVSAMLYGVLRECALPRIHAGAIAALTLLFPWADSTRFWPTASMASLSIAVALAGLWVALAGLRRGGGWRWHAGAIALYLLSILTYELTALLIAAAGLLYLARGGWRAARWRWPADLVAIGIAAVWNSSHTPRPQKFGLDALWHHFSLIVTEGGKVLARSAQPLGTARTTLVLVVLLLVALAGAVVAIVRRRSATGVALRPWLALLAAGLVVTAAGWLIFVPTDVYYTPTTLGFTNRVNALAALGLVMAVYAVAGIAGTLIGAGARRPVVATAITLVLAVVLGAGYVKALDRHSDLWVGAFEGQMGALRNIKAQYPRVPDDSTLLTFGYPGYQAPGVPIFAVSWDLDNALKLQYHNNSLHGYPVVAPTAVQCTSGGVVVGGGAISGAPPIPYGRAILFDVPSGRHDVPRSARACRAAAPSYTPGSPGLSVTY